MLLVRNHLSRTVLPENASLPQLRERVEAKIKLGEFYWRYRAVLPGESPLAEAIAVLEEVCAMHTTPAAPSRTAPLVRPLTRRPARRTFAHLHVHARVVCACACGIRMRVWYAHARVVCACACGMRVRVWYPRTRGF